MQKRGVPVLPSLQSVPLRIAFLTWFLAAFQTTPVQVESSKTTKERHTRLLKKQNNAETSKSEAQTDTEVTTCAEHQATKR